MATEGSTMQILTILGFTLVWRLPQGLDLNPQRLSHPEFPHETAL